MTTLQKIIASAIARTLGKECQINREDFDLFVRTFPQHNFEFVNDEGQNVIVNMKMVQRESEGFTFSLPVITITCNGVRNERAEMQTNAVLLLSSVPHGSYDPEQKEKQNA